MRPLRHRARALGLLVGTALAVATPSYAQRAGDGFLFREPPATLTVSGGYARARAGSDIFSFSTEQLTLGRSDFSGLTGSAELAVRLTPRLALSLQAAYTGRIADSEFRDWVDQEDRPIEQTTLFERVPLSANVRAYLLPRGRRVGSFAWIPAKVAPYVGAGAGTMWYRFRQNGDFVDYKTLDVFSDVLESQGWAPTAQALAGADLSLTPRLALTGEARYGWGHARLGKAFSEFGPIDLSGLSATVGLTVRF